MKRYYSFFFFFLVLISAAGESYAQCTLKKRVYASNTEAAADLLTSVSNANSAIDGNPKNYSTLNVPIGALNLLNATQFLEFKDGGNPKNISANTPVTIKLTLPKTIAGVLDNVTIQPFTNLRKPALLPWTATPAGTSFTSASLLNVVNGAGEIELTIKPTASFQGVWVKVGSVLGLGVSLNIFHAYIEENDNSTNLNCNAAIDVLSGVKAVTGIGGIANSSGTVDNPYNAIDSDLNTFSALNVGAQVLSEVFETVIFNTASQPNDEVEIILQNVAGGLLDVNLLTGFTIQAYNGTATAGNPINSSSTFLSLNLLSGTAAAGNAKYLLKARIPDAFDRVEVKMGGVAGVLSGLRIYDVKRKIAPAILFNGIETTSRTICEGESITFNVSPQTCTSYKWFDVATGGTPLSTTSSLTVNNNITTKTYYVEATRTNACNNVSDRVPVSVTVNPRPSIALGTMPEVCRLISQAIIPFSNPLNAPATYKIVWDQASLNAGFANIEQTLPGNSKIELSLPSNLPPSTYNGILTVRNANNCSSSAQNIQVTVKPTPPAPNIDIQTFSQY